MESNGNDQSPDREHVSLQALCREHGRNLTAIVEQLLKERPGDIGVSQRVADQLADAWREEDATLQVAERARRRDAAVRAERRRIWDAGCRLWDRVTGLQADLAFSRRQLERESEAVAVQRIENRRDTELVELKAALAEWTAWAEEHPELSEAVRLRDSGGPGEPAARTLPKPNWVQEAKEQDRLARRQPA